MSITENMENKVYNCFQLVYRYLNAGHKESAFVQYGRATAFMQILREISETAITDRLVNAKIEIEDLLYKED